MARVTTRVAAATFGLLAVLGALGSLGAGLEHQILGAIGLGTAAVFFVALAMLLLRQDGSTPPPPASESRRSWLRRGVVVIGSLLALLGLVTIVRWTVADNGSSQPYLQFDSTIEIVSTSTVGR